MTNTITPNNSLKIWWISLILFFVLTLTLMAQSEKSPTAVFAHASMTNNTLQSFVPIRQLDNLTGHEKFLAHGHTVYATQSFGLDVIAYDINSQTRTTLISNAGFNSLMTLSADKTKLYVYRHMNDRFIDVFDTGTNNLLQTYELSSDSWSMYKMRFDAQQRTYLAAGVFIEIWDETLTNRSTLPIYNMLDPYSFDFEIWENSLYLLRHDTQNGLNRQIVEYDLSGETPTAVFTQTVPVSDARTLQIAPDGSFLLTSGGFYGHKIERETLNIAYPLPTREWMIISNDSQALFSTYYTRGQSSDLVIEQYSASTGEITHRKVSQPNRFEDRIYGIAPIEDNNFLLHISAVLRPGEALPPQIYTQANYQNFVPFISNEACLGGPIFDDFADPTSRWPIINNEAVQTFYANGEYNMTVYAAPHWSGVTRRDYWRNGRQILVTARARGSGSAGLIIGLKPDWSEFYNFEYYPAFGVWALFHYTNSTGWELIRYDYTARLEPSDKYFQLGVHMNYGGESISLTFNPEPHTSNFGYGVTSLLLPLEGYVGLSGGTESTGTFFHYDNYVVRSTNCYAPEEVPYLATINEPPVEDMVQTMVLPRPSFTNFLTTEQQVELFSRLRP